MEINADLTFLYSYPPPPSRLVYLGDGVLLPGWYGLAAPRVHAARPRGRLPGLVALPGPHLLPSAHDGRRPAGVGRPQPQPELLPHDRIQGGLVIPHP